MTWECSQVRNLSLGNAAVALHYGICSLFVIAGPITTIIIDQCKIAWMDIIESITGLDLGLYGPQA